MRKRTGERAAFLLAVVACAGLEPCASSASFALPPGPNTDKLLHRMVELAPPLSDFPEILDREGPPEACPPSRGAHFAEYSSADIRNVLAAQRHLHAQDQRCATQAPDDEWSDGDDEKGSAYDEDARWGGELESQSGPVGGEVGEFLRAIEGGACCSESYPARRWAQDVVDAVYRRISRCHTWWQAPPSDTSPPRKEEEKETNTPAQAREGSPEVVPRGIWAEALAKTNAAVAAAQQAQQGHHKGSSGRGDTGGGSGGDNGRVSAAPAPARLVRRRRQREQQRIISYNGGTGVWPCQCRECASGAAASQVIGYSWAQDTVQVLLSFKVPTNCRSRDVSVKVSNRRLQVAIELEGGGSAGGAPGGRHARTVVDRALAYSVLEEETDGCWELLDVSAERLLVVTLPKSTEGWTFQSPYDTIWWDAVFAEQVRAVHVERMDREMHSLTHYFSSLSQTLRAMPLPPPPPPSARKGLEQFAELPLAEEPASETLKYHVVDLVLSYLTTYRVHRGEPEVRPEAAAALLGRVSHVLHLHQGPGGAVNCHETVCLWEEATEQALGLQFGALLPELRLQLLRDAECVLLDRDTCVRVLRGVKRLLDLARPRTPWHHMRTHMDLSASLNASRNFNASHAPLAVEGCAIPDDVAHLFIRRLVPKSHDLHSPIHLPHKPDLGHDIAVEQQEEGEAGDAEQGGGGEEQEQKEEDGEEEEEREEMCLNRAGMAKAAFMASWRASLAQEAFKVVAKELNIVRTERAYGLRLRQSTKREEAAKGGEMDDALNEHNKWSKAGACAGRASATEPASAASSISGSASATSTHQVGTITSAHQVGTVTCQSESGVKSCAGGPARAEVAVAQDGQDHGPQRVAPEHGGGSGLIGDAGDGWEEDEERGEKRRDGDGARKARKPGSLSGASGSGGGGGEEEGRGGSKPFVPKGCIDADDWADDSFSDGVDMPWLSISQEALSVPELEHMEHIEDMTPNMLPSDSSILSAPHEDQRGWRGGEGSKRVLMQGDQGPVDECDQDRLGRDAGGVRAEGSVQYCVLDEALRDEPLRDAADSMDGGMVRPTRDVNVAHVQVLRSVLLYEVQAGDLSASLDGRRGSRVARRCLLVFCPDVWNIFGRI